MDGMFHDRPPVKLSGVGGNLNGNIRYPKITPDGAFIYFIEQGISVGGSGPGDRVVMTNPHGQIIWATEPNDLGRVRYPQLIAYKHEPNLEIVSFLIAVSSHGVGLSSVGWEDRLAWGYTNQDQSTDPADFINDPNAWLAPTSPDNYNGKHQTLLNHYTTEFAAVPQDFVKEKHGGQHPTKYYDLYSADEGELSWNVADKFGGSQVPINPWKCPSSQDVFPFWNSRTLSSGNSPRSLLYVRMQDRFKVGWTGTDPVLHPLKTKTAYSPSISSDGKYLMWNSDTHKGDPLRDEEMMYSELPPPGTHPCNAYKVGSNPFIQGSVFKNKVEYLTNAPGDEYARFAVNTGYYFVMHRGNDPDNAGMNTLYISQDLQSTPVRLHPSENHGEKEADWFYKAR